MDKRLMFDQSLSLAIETDAATTQQHAVRLGAMPKAPLAMPRQILERSPARGALLPRLFNLFSPRFGA